MDLYENVKEIGLIPPRWTGQVEYAQPYNQRTPFFLQTRLFREKSPKADWMIKDTYGMGSQSEESADFDTFGVTPEAGITAEIRWLMTPDLGANKFAYMEIPNRKADNNPTPPLKNMDLYIMSIMGRGMLNHGAFRHLQQASIGANFLLFKYSERFTSPCGPFS